MTIAPEVVVVSILFALVIVLTSRARRPGTQPTNLVDIAPTTKIASLSEDTDWGLVGGDLRDAMEGNAPVARPVFHRQPKKNRRDALRPCNGIAFLTTRTDGVEIPQTCQTCGQPLQVRYLDFSRVVETRLSVDVARQPRHYGAKGTPVTEIER